MALRLRRKMSYLIPVFAYLGVKYHNVCNFKMMSARDTDTQGKRGGWREITANVAKYEQRVSLGE